MWGWRRPRGSRSPRCPARWSYETVLVVPPGHRLSESASAVPGDLAGEPLLAMEPGTNLRTFVDRLLGLSGVEARITMELDSVEAIKRMVEAGIGVALLPRVSVEAEAEAGRLVGLPLTGVPLPDREMLLLWRKDRRQDAILQAFLEPLLTPNLPRAPERGED
jgi:DNA-binding transcriptional LysR family regulator